LSGKVARPLTGGTRDVRSLRRTRPPYSDRDHAIMDIERINAIGNGLADLSERTEALRGYL
jgi:hypothetical protein